ncbi:MAG: iron-sulfur cluster-binding domain-containing protein [Candidatus Sericytochromatia bacterium]
MLKNIINKLIINIIGRDTTEYISSNTMNLVMKKINPFIWTYDLKLLVLEKYYENESVITLTLLPNQHWQQAKAGQYVELKFNINGKEYKRNYSISSIDKNIIKITIKRIENGLISNWIHKNLNIGDEIQSSGALGNFIYKQQKKILFISAGTGITPCFSIFNDLIKNKNNLPDINFFSQFSKEKDLVFKNELDTIKKNNFPNLKIDVITTKNKLTVNNFKEYFPDFMDRSIYLCGPEGFMTMVINILEKSNYDFNNLYIENFYEKANLLNKENIISSKIYFKTYNKEVILTKNDTKKTLLDIGLENGLNLEKGCKKGICGTCKLVLHEGDVIGNKLGKVVYLCTSYPNSELVVIGT